MVRTLSLHDVALLQTHNLSALKKQATCQEGQRLFALQSHTKHLLKAKEPASHTC